MKYFFLVDSVRGGVIGHGGLLSVFLHQQLFDLCFLVRETSVFIFCECQLIIFKIVNIYIFKTFSVLL